MAYKRRKKKPASEKEMEQRGKEFRDDSSKRYGGATPNDAKWYGADELLLKDAGKVSFNNALGRVMTLDQDGVTMTPGARSEATVPGIMVIPFIPTLGKSVDGTSAVNMAALTVFTKIRREINGARTYDRADVMMNLGALDSLITWYYHGCRVYRAALTYSSLNTYLGDALISSLGFDPTSLRDNLGNFKFYLDILRNKIKRFFVPGGMYVYLRHKLLSSVILFDHQEVKSQMYAFVPAGYFTWYDAGTAGTQLVYTDESTIYTTGGVKLNVSSYSTIMELMLNALINSTDFGTINGDIEKTFVNDLSLEPVTENDVIDFLYSEEMLEQIQNLTLLPNGFNDPVNAVTGSMDVTQDPTRGWIIYNPKWPNSATAVDTPYRLQRVVCVTDNEPNSERIMNATRGTYSFVYDSVTDTHSIDEFGSEIFCAAWINYYNEQGNLTFYGPYSWCMTRTSTPGTYSWADIKLLSAISKFDWHPQFVHVTYGTQAIDLDGYASMYDIQNYSVFDYNALRKLHRTAVLAEFDVKAAGKV